LNQELASLFQNKLEIGASITKQILLTKVKECLSPQYIIVVNGIKEIRKGKPPVIVIQVEKRQSKKHITTIRGLEELGINIHQVSHLLSTKFATSTTIRKIPLTQNKEITEIHLLGNRSLKIRDILKDDYKIPQSHIEIVLGKGVKNKEEKIITRKIITTAKSSEVKKTTSPPSGKGSTPLQTQPQKQKDMRTTPQNEKETDKGSNKERNKKN